MGSFGRHSHLCNCVIVACAAQGNMVEALRLKDEMINCGKLMNLVVAKALMKEYFSQGNFDSALNLFFNYHYSYYLGVEGLAKKKKS